MKKIGVIAGTPTDTRMGAEYFEGRGMEVVAIPASGDSRAALEFFAADEDYKIEQMKAAISKIKEESGEAICVYCNALSAAVDFKSLSRSEKIIIVTPFDAYEKIAGEYKVIGNLAATTGTLAKFEETVQKVNPDADVQGQHLQRLTDDIEKGEAPAGLIERFGLKNYVEFCEKSGCDCLILTCTHFPYLKEELQELTAIPIIDPADTMFQLMD
ncbi:MAG: aspartate/glutamate racemase family protein [Firmicutes bacterium]|nr:aspartate/glutamate racemase family protein [Bacillota bacterium]